MGFTEGINRAGSLVDEAISVASSKRETIVKQGANIALVFIILAVFGCLDFATLTFHPEYLATVSYWGTVATKVVAGVCAFNVGINCLLDAEIRKNGQLNKLIEEYNRLLEYKQQDFDYYVDRIFNREEKRKAYIARVNRMIYRLNRLSRPRDRLLYSSSDPAKAEERNRNRYCIKRTELEELKKPEYIEKNLDSLYVRYKEVDPAVFELEIDGSEAHQGVRVKGSVSRGRAKASSSVILGMVGFSMFITSFGLSADKEQFESQMVAFWHYFLKVVEDVGIVLWQFTRGMFASRKIVSEQYTQPYAGRVLVLRAYAEWRLENNRPNGKLYDEMEKEKGYEIVEVTQEELDKLKSSEAD